MKIEDYGDDVGIASSLARTLMYYAAGTRKHGTYDDAPRALASQLLDREVVLLMLRAGAPDWITIWMAQGLVIISSGLLWSGIRIFERHRPK